MRELKFRYFHRLTKNMFWHNLREGSRSCGGSGWLTALPINETDYTAYPQDSRLLLDPHDVVIMQFTGIQSKMGQDVWEGDIINHDSTIYPCKIFYKRKYAQFMAKEMIEKGGKVWHITHDKVIEVTGNIYQHPELLKTKE